MNSEQLLRAELERLTERMPGCGHRRVDAADSDGECTFCKLRAMAAD
jgi:hypothetical protein